ncbi:MAG TPA: UvrB/UvrC motif-containing protein [Terriglobia bacterium]|nr:UvrB/UvrC motif-containing protein [Terriglobia bacterium]
MKLQSSARFDPGAAGESFFGRFEHRSAVFTLFPDGHAAAGLPPYIGRTSDLHRRLLRLLGERQRNSKLLSLREITRLVEYQYVGSPFEAQWLLYHLNRVYYPRHYRARLRLKSPALLKLNLSNRFPRCYPTRRIANDGSLYYGPFPSRPAAERFAAEFLDLFKVRRCVEELEPDPAHPGCIYSQMRMCMAPCFKGCTDAEYQSEVKRLMEFLASQGQSMASSLEAERDRASESLDFEGAARLHRKIDKVHDVLRLKPEPVRSLPDLHAVVIVPGAEPQSVSFFLLRSGHLCGPASLALDENVPSPLPLDERLHLLFQTLLAGADGAAKAPLWEHLSLFSKWYYSSFRKGEIVMLPSSAEIPHARLIRLCRKVIANPA